MVEVKGNITMCESAKRVYADIEIKMICPKCKGVMVTNLDCGPLGQYLSYPFNNKDQDIYFYCSNCHNEYNLPAEITGITITLEFEKSDLEEQ